MPRKLRCRAALVSVLTSMLLSITVGTSSAQKTNKLEIEHWREVLRSVERELKENYYDPAFNGIDIDARFNLADAKMKTAESMVDLASIVAQVLLDLNNRHTFFIPPDDGSRIDYCWRVKPVGDDAPSGRANSETNKYSVRDGADTSVYAGERFRSFEAFL